MGEFLIQRLGHLGDGLTDGPDGMVLAPLTLPGERIEGEPEGGRIGTFKIVTPSADRVTAPCPHFRSCGGCSLQHASDSFVADWKADLVRRALAAHGIEAPIRPIQTSPPASRIRATLAGRRTKKGTLVGFHGRSSRVLVEVPNCLVLHPDLLATLPALHEITRLGGSRDGVLSFSLTLSDVGVDLLVTGGKPLTPAILLDLPRFREAFVRLTWDGEPIFTLLPPSQTFGRVRVTPPAGAFLQATREGAGVLLSAAKEAIGDARHIVELFAGCGTFTFPLAEAARVDAYEGASHLTHALDDAARHSSALKPIHAVTRDLYRNSLLADDFKGADAVLLDPPRAGAEAQIPAIVAAAVPRIAYLSCNPVSFARDANILVAGGYRLEWVQPVDQFRWSPHLELAAAFTRDHIAVA